MKKQAPPDLSKWKPFALQPYRPPLSPAALAATVQKYGDFFVMVPKEERWDALEYLISRGRNDLAMGVINDQRFCEMIADKGGRPNGRGVAALAFIDQARAAGDRRTDKKILADSPFKDVTGGAVSQARRRQKPK